ncbi:hypothetical protein QVD17_39313 [Tagetes erecta]|uniref:Uncharacterized protein n=1 Tax=Tagetes erecta TaxID=13708 RepID=A0AAD8JQ08_TARER|nr:hypothetical protein QVD17_39313 [Tagetes erecta]
MDPGLSRAFGFGFGADVTHCLKLLSLSFIILATIQKFTGEYPPSLRRSPPLNTTHAPVNFVLMARRFLYVFRSSLRFRRVKVFV